LKESKKKIITETIDKNKISLLKDIIKSEKKFNISQLPYGGHWVFFNENISIKEIGVDGHPKRGSFFPKLLGYKRMFAGCSLEFKRDIGLESTIKKVSYIKEVVRKKNQANSLIFFKLHNSYIEKKIELLKEIQTIVFVKNNYKSKKKNDNKKVYSNLDLLFSKTFTYNNVDLFKYSALTNNSHRIHYDLQYAREVEGHKGLLVHGPLIATTVLNEINNLIKKKITSFNFSIITPILVNEKFTLKIYRFKEFNKNFHIKIFTGQAKKIAFIAEAVLS
jgi:3-methylfumaryl-CoA hydratase